MYNIIYSNYKSFIDLTEGSNKINTNSSSNEDGADIKLEPDDIHDSIVDVSEQIENNSVNSQLSQNVNTFGKNLSGNYCSKKKLFNCLD